MNQEMLHELTELADGKKLYTYQGRDFPLGIVRVEDFHEWNGKKITISPENSLYVLPPERTSDTKFFAALIFADWGNMSYRVWLRRGLLADHNIDGGSFNALELAMQAACELLLRSLDFGGAAKQDYRRFAAFFDGLPPMPEDDWDEYCKRGDL